MPETLEVIVERLRGMKESIDRLGSTMDNLTEKLADQYVTKEEFNIVRNEYVSWKQMSPYILFIQGLISATCLAVLYQIFKFVTSHIM